MTEHTPTPWNCASAYSSICGVPIVGQDGKRIGNTALPQMPKEWVRHHGDTGVSELTVNHEGGPCECACHEDANDDWMEQEYREMERGAKLDEETDLKIASGASK